MTTKPTSPAAARRAAKQAVQTVSVVPDGLPAEVSEKIRAYRPLNIDPVVWESVRPAVVEVVYRSAPLSTAHAQHRLLPMSKLAAWAHGQGVALDPATLLSERVVEEWVRQTLAAGDRPASVATFRSILRTIAAQVAPMSAGTKSTVKISRSDGPEPYTTAEDLLVRRAVTGQRTPVYRATGCLLYGLSRGAGLISVDFRKLRSGGDVQDFGDRISIDVNGRTVWVLDEFCNIVRAGLSIDRGDGWLLAGRYGQRRNIGEYVDRFTVPAGTPRLNLSRCRATWIVDHLNRGTPVTVIRDALGVNGLSAVERMLAYTDPIDDDSRAQLLRGTS